MNTRKSKYEFKKGRTGCRGCFISSAEPMTHWPSLIQHAAHAASLIAKVFGRGHYDVTMPTYSDSVGFDEGSLVTPYSFMTPAQTMSQLSSLDVPPLHLLDVCKKMCHPAAFYYCLTS